MNIYYCKTREDAVPPVYASSTAAGGDLRYAGDKSVTVYPGDTYKFRTGICVEIPEGYFGMVAARSGFSINKGMAPANKVGIIDSDYRGEIIVALRNHGHESVIVSPGDRIAQLLIMPVVKGEYVEVLDLDDTERGSGGFGSTGTN